MDRRLPGEESLGEPKLLEPLAPNGLVSVIVRLAHAEERHAEPLGQHLAELGLAGAGGPYRSTFTPEAPESRAPFINLSTWSRSAAT